MPLSAGVSKPVLFVSGIHNALLLVCLVCIAIIGDGINGVFLSEYDVKLLSRELVCVTPPNIKCVYLYNVIDKNGDHIRTALRGYKFSEPDLEKNSHILKEKFHAYYYVNGSRVEYGHYGFYARVILVFTLALISWIFLARRKQRDNSDRQL